VTDLGLGFLAVGFCPAALAPEAQGREDARQKALVWHPVVRSANLSTSLDSEHHNDSELTT
jgi:hypothetical protein